MTPERVLEVIEIYRGKFKEIGVEPVDHPHDELLELNTLGLCHCYGMLDKMVEFVHEGRMDKVFRWLGFIQGCLWSMRFNTLTDLMNHNRPST